MKLWPQPALGMRGKVGAVDPFAEVVEAAGPGAGFHRFLAQEDRSYPRRIRSANLVPSRESTGSRHRCHHVEIGRLFTIYIRNAAVVRIFSLFSSTLSA
jgi:hypothetical protein